MKPRFLIAALSVAVTAAAMSPAIADGGERRPRTTTSRSTTKSSTGTSAKKQKTKKREAAVRVSECESYCDGDVLHSRKIIVSDYTKPAVLEVYADGILITKDDGSRIFHNSSNPLNVRNTDGSWAVFQILDNKVSIRERKKDRIKHTIIDCRTGKTTTKTESGDGEFQYTSSTSSSSSSSSSTGVASSHSPSTYSYSYSYSYPESQDTRDSNIYMYLPDDRYGDTYLPKLQVSKSKPYATCMRRLAFLSGESTEVDFYFMTSAKVTIKDAELYLGSRSYTPVGFKDITVDANTGTGRIPCLALRFDTGYFSEEPGGSDKLVLTLQNGAKVTVPLAWPSEVEVTKREPEHTAPSGGSRQVPPRNPMAD